MNTLFKKLLFLWVLLFSHFLYADEANIGIHITNASANEADGTMTFTITLDEAPILPITIDYKSSDGSAIAGTDYEAVDDYLYFALGISSRTFTVNIIDNNVYEGNKNFTIAVSSDSTGYYSTGDGTGTILEDENPPLSVSVYGDVVNEGDDNSNTATFTFKLNQPAPSGGVSLSYKTVDATAIANEDYFEKSDDITIAEGESQAVINVSIIGDTIPDESTQKHFFVEITSLSTGEINNGSAYGIINDDDAIAVHVACEDQEEGNPGDTNVVSCEIYLNKEYPLDESLNISYSSADGSNPSAIKDEDYLESFGSVTFSKGDKIKNVDISILEDTEIEYDEYVKMTISGSDYIVTNSDEAKIINDDGSFPAISFESSTFSIVEGNSSQSNLTFTFTLDKPALEDSSFHYETWDDTAEDEAKDNDYTYTHGDYNIATGASSFSIDVPIIGDIKIENDETFHFGIENLNKLKLQDNNEAVGIIINDDGTYPTLTASSDTFTIVEGNTSQVDMNFTFTLDKAALEGSSFDYYTTHNTTNSDDFKEIERSTFTFSGGETNITIPVSIQGDTQAESDETFYLKIDNEHNLTISGSQSLTGTIINDDEREYPFSCDEESFISWNTETYATSGNSLFNTISLATGELIWKETLETIDGVNSIGYNTKDNFIWGYNLDLNKVVRIDNQHKIKVYDIAGLDSKFYVAADVDKDGILYLFSRGDSEEQQMLVPVDLNNLTALPIVALNKEIDTADMAFSPIDGHLYFIQKDTDNLYKIVLSDDKKSGDVILVGDTKVGTADPIINFFDKDGNFYFNKDTKSMYKVDITSSAEATWFSELDNELRNGDGARCANAAVHQPIDENEPLTCDSTMYISSSLKRGTSETGKMWLHTINTQSSPFAFDVVDDDGDSRLYNALAYSDAGDENSTDYIFGLYHDELIKMGKSGKVISLGTIDALSDLLSNRQLFAGAAYDGYYYISGPGVDYDKIFKIDLSDKSVTDINLSTAISLLDFSFTPDGKYLHGIIAGGELVKIDVENGDVTKIGLAHTGYQFDSTFSDQTGRFFANDSKGNGFFEFDLETGEKLFLSESQEATFNDGANCLKEELVFVDHGDAPHDEGKYYGDAWHNIIGGIYLGEKVDHDVESYDNIEANGDDTNGTDDEDGVTFANGSPLEGAIIEQDSTLELKVVMSKEAYIRIWLDLNVDGSFDNGHDLVYDDKLSGGEHNISIAIPDGLPANVTTYLRARVSTVPAMDFEGYLKDGEVEDYALQFKSDFKGIPGTFNVERTDSYTQAINSDERNAWYTQIVGKDFDYHVVFYDENITTEQNLTNVPIKVELIDLDKPEGNNSIAAPHYDYFYESSSFPSRVLVTAPTYDEDLKNTLATKRAVFRVLYPAYDDGSVRQFECDDSLTAEECYNAATAPQEDTVILVKSAYAKDEFAIRPERVYVTLLDNNQTILNSKVDRSIALSAGYEYNLTVTATQYSEDTPAKGYTKLADSSIEMNSTGLTCNDTSPINEPIDFKDGLFQDSSFNHKNVGEYLLKIEDDKTWTEVDQNSTVLGCIPNSGERVADVDGKVGCDIVVDKYDSELIFYPDHFDVALTMSNLPQSGHPDFIYMMELNATNNNVAIAFKGNITAQTKDNIATKNFTSGCVATNLLLDLNATTISTNGTNVNITTADNLTAVNFSRVIRFNNETDPSKFNVNNTLSKIGTLLSIDSDKFLNENNGSMSLDMRYNLNKNIKQPIDPVEVTFNSIEVTAPDANSLAYEITSHIPDGNSTFKDNVKNFYFARVVSDLNNYPRVNMNISPLIRTPLNVDIYCGTPLVNYCKDRNVIANSNISGTVREQNGYYVSFKHNGELDGNVTGLSDNPHMVTISPNPNSDISLNNGANGTVNEVFINCNNPSSTITIKTDPVLAFEPSEYTVNCTDANASQWTGVGKTGNVLEVHPKVQKTRKMDW
jgi:hypothetical protein